MTIRHAATKALCARKYRVSHNRRMPCALSDGVCTAYSLSGAALLEQRLHTAYDKLCFHIFDASSAHWRTRQDYPHHLLFSSAIDSNALASWTPSGVNPSLTSSTIQKKLHSIPTASKAVVIHPKIMQRVTIQPAYAGEILVRITDWFTFDATRADSVVPGASAFMAQAVAIGADGQIANAFSTNPVSGRIATCKKDFNYWDKRSELHRYYTNLHRKPCTAKFEAPSDIAAFSRVLGNTIDGISVDVMLAAVPKAAIGVWGI